MSTNKEIEALVQVSEALEKIDENARERVLQWAASKYNIPKLITAPLNSASDETFNQKPSINYPSKRKLKKSSQTLSYSLLKELNFRPEGVISFKDFYDQKQPKSNPDFLAVAVYWLEKIAGLEGICPNHIYTCFKHIGLKPLKHIPQFIYDTATRKGYIRSSDINNLSITIVGENFVDHDLPCERGKLSR